MDDKQLEYYNRELIYLREMGAEFAQRYPKVAGRLGIQGIDVADPYVERLMEGFAFLTARIQRKYDAEFPRFTRQLLDTLYPNFLSPLPSMAIAELQPDQAKGDISSGFVVPRGTKMHSQRLKRKGITCTYTTAHDVTLQPLRIVNVMLGGIPGDLPLAQLELQDKGCTSALRITLEIFDTVTLEDLQIQPIMFFLSGPDIQAQQLQELLMQHTVGVVCQTVEDCPQRHALDKTTLQQEGFAADQALLPNDLRQFEGYRLLQEYFAFPARFQFFSLSDLQPLIDQVACSKNKPRQFEIIALLDGRNEGLERVVDTDSLSLNCTPVINLFHKTAERLTVDEKHHEFHLVMDNIRPLDYEVFSIVSLRGEAAKGRPPQDFRPFYQTYSTDTQHHGAYYAQRREPRPLSEYAQRQGTRTRYTGSEMFVSIVDEHHAPWHKDLTSLAADVMCTNRDLPLLLEQQGTHQFAVSDSMPVKQIVLKKGPTAPRPAREESASTWQFISQLQLNYLGMLDISSQEGSQKLRQLLTLYADHSEPAVAKQIQGVRHCILRPVSRRMPEPGPLVFGRGIAIDVTVDDSAFSGGSPYLLGCVLENLFSRLVSINSFTEMTLISQQRGKIAHWPSRAGKKPLV